MRSKSSPDPFAVGSIALALGILVCAGSWCQTSPGTPLAPGKPIARQLAPGETHLYTVELLQGEVARVAVAQLGLDVRIRVSIPGVPEILEQNGLQTSRGQEIVVAAAGVAGTLGLEVRAFDAQAAAGAYEIVLQSLAPAPTPGELAGARAWIEMAKAARLDLQQTAEGREQAAAAFAQAVALWRQAGDPRGEAETRYLQGLVSDRQGHLSEAVELLSEALRLQRILGDRVAEACTLSDRGVTYDDLGRPDEALADLEAARTLSQQLDDPRGLSRSLLNIASVHDKQGDHRQASEEYAAVVALCRTSGDRRCQGAALNNLGRIHSLNGEPREAMARYGEALDLWQAIGNKVNAAWTVMNLGAVEESIGQPREALERYEIALRLHRENGDRRGEAFTLHNRAAADADLGETQRALDDYAQALELWRETGDRRGEGTTLTNLARLYADLGEAPRALDLYQQALALHQASQTKYSQASTRYQLGRLYESLGRLREADEQYASAVALWQETGSRRRTGLALAARGSVALASGRPEAALALQQEAVLELREAQNRRGEAEALTALARTLAALGRTPEALEQLAAALAIEREVGDRAAEAETLFTRAGLARRAGDDDGARSDIEQALARIHQLRARVMTSNLRAKFLITKRQYVRFLIDLLVDLAKRRPGEGFEARALQVHEQFLARNLVDSLVARGADLRPESGVELVKRERDLVTRVAALDFRQTRLVERDEDGQAAGIERELDDLLAELDRVQTEILEQSPRYAELTQPRPLDAAEIQSRLLDPATVVLEYSLGPQRSFLWIVSRSTLRVAELPPRAEIERAAAELLGVLGEGPQPLAQRRLDRSAAALGEMLLGLAGDLGGFSRLLIVPDGVLRRIPFALLTAKGAPLVAKHEIVLLPSLSVLGALRRSPPAPSSVRRTVAVFADPVFRRDDPRLARRQPAVRGGSGLADEVSRSAEDFGIKHLPRLPKSLAEARSIRKLLPADQVFMALSFDARKSLLFDGSLGASRVLHFATHALLNEKRPELSGLVLSLVDRQGRELDGFLRLSEVYNLRLASELVVLSACRTALGRELEGEGLLGLTRGFLHAGASAVVASLWNVDDRATSELMKRTYRKMLKEGLPPSSALRAAQASMWAEGWHPYDWAGFVFQGDWQSLPAVSPP